MNDQTLNILNNGGVGVLLTDTLYGLVGQALNKKTVERIYKIKGRDKKKPLIILISSVEDLKLFGIRIDPVRSSSMFSELKSSKAKPTFVSDHLKIKRLFQASNGVDQQTREKLLEFWNQSDPASIILPCLLRKFAYLHCGSKSLAFRLPQKRSLIKILKETGPLVAPSANPESSRPAENIRQAKQYFGDQVDFYLKGGRPQSKSSKIIKIDKGEVVVIRR